MSGKLKEVRGRIQSVKNTQQITKAMKMVSAAKLRRAQDAILQMRPYAEKLQDILQNIASGAEGDIAIEYAQEREVENVLLVLITSDRGLCGSFNSNLQKLALQTIKERYSKEAETGNLSVLTIGKKGYEFLAKRGYKVNTQYKDLFLDLNFENAADAAGFIMNSFISGKYDKIEVIYSRFRNAAVQVFKSEQFLPIINTEGDDEAPQKAKGKEQEEISAVRPNFIFEPSKEAIIKELVPKILKTQFFKYLLENNASEHGARMTAMDNATENANELLKDLRISYNRARQAAITTELTEIVSGANALEEG